MGDIDSGDRLALRGGLLGGQAAHRGAVSGFVSLVELQIRALRQRHLGAMWPAKEHDVARVSEERQLLAYVCVLGVTRAPPLVALLFERLRTKKRML